jgi:antitoxin ParD1/3/4
MTQAFGNLDEAVARLIASGRYASREEVIREGVRLLEERERKLEALDKALARGLADADAGLVTPAGNVFDRLESKYRAMASK